MDAKTQLLEKINASRLDDISKYLWEIFVGRASDADIRLYDEYISDNPDKIKLITEIIEKKLWAFSSGNGKYMKNVIDFEVAILRNMFD